MTDALVTYPPDLLTESNYATRLSRGEVVKNALGHPIGTSRTNP